MSTALNTARPPREHYVARAGRLYAAGEHDLAIEMLRRDDMARWRDDLEARARASAPSRGDRIAGAILGVGKGAFPPFMCSLVAGALHQPAAAAAIGTLTLAMAAVGALVGFCNGGRI